MNSLPLLQIAIVITAAKVLGQAFRKLDQPAVVGEMVAGFVLGPIVLGSQFPELHTALFDPSSKAALQVLGELGLVLFMFLVGIDFVPPSTLTARRSGMPTIAACSLLVPFAAGALLAVTLHARFAPPNVGVLPFSIFIGTVMSVTAFPVLAAILNERGMLAQKEGYAALFATAVTDAAAWVLLAIVTLVHNKQGNWISISIQVAGLGALCMISLHLCRPWMSRLAACCLQSGKGVNMLFGYLLIGAFIYAAFTEWLGVHPAFGAFLFGVCVPRERRLGTIVVKRIESLVMVALLPCFFALVGLSATSTSFAGAGWSVLALVILAAVAGKLIGGILGARLCGWPWGSALTVGILLNTKGLMELVILKVGFDMGIIETNLFSIFFVMTIITTVMTSPLLNLLARHRLPVASIID